MTLQEEKNRLIAEYANDLGKLIGTRVIAPLHRSALFESFADALLEEVAKVVELERADSDGVHDAEYVAYNDAVVDCAHAIRLGKGK